MKRKSWKEPVQVSEGSYRQIFEVGPKVLGKLLKLTRTKNYGPFRLKHWMKTYTLLKFGTLDVNKQALANYKRLMKMDLGSLRENFARLIGIRGQGNKSILLAEKIKDFNGTQSKNLLETGPIRNEAFWKRLAEIETFFLKNHLPFFNLGADNIVVQWTDKQNCKPVFIDFKRMSPRSLPLQPDLLLKSRVDKKLRRRFAKLRNNFQAKNTPLDKRLKNSEARLLSRRRNSLLAQPRRLLGD